MNHDDTIRCLEELERCRSNIRRLIPGTCDPDDVFQEAWIAAFHGNAPRSSGGPNAQWLCRVARNLAVSEYRRESIRGYVPLTAESANDQLRDPSSELERKELRATIHEIVQSLPPIYQHVITKRHFDEKPISEIADELGLPEQTVRTRYKRALNRLRQRPRLGSIAAAIGLDHSVSDRTYRN